MPGPSHSDDGGRSGAAREKRFLIGLVPEENIFRQVERYTPLADYLSQRIGEKVQLKATARYGKAIDGLVSGSLDAAFFGSFAYVLAHDRAGVEALARPEWSRGGLSTCHALIITRKGSGIRRIGQMRGKTLAFVDRASMAGYLFPMAYFREHDVKDHRSFFRETYFTGTHEDAIYDVLKGRADLGAVKSSVFERLARLDKKIGEELLVVAKSDEVPENAFGVRKDLERGLRARVGQALLSIGTDGQADGVLTAFGARRFVPTSDSEYAPVLRYARAVGINLARYEYARDR